MHSRLLHSLEIFSELGVEGVGNELSEGSIADVSLSVQEESGDVVLYSGSQTMRILPVGLAMMSLILLISSSVSSPALHRGYRKTRLPLVEINLSDFEEEGGEPSTDTLDDSDGERNLASSVDVGILDS